jgi:hypothetical protein
VVAAALYSGSSSSSSSMTHCDAGANSLFGSFICLLRSAYLHARSLAHALANEPNCKGSMYSSSCETCSVVAVTCVRVFAYLAYLSVG